jgi:hypothetical protein
MAGGATGPASASLGLRERRRLERDLHDGAQQRLVALALTLRLAREKLGRPWLAARPELPAGPLFCIIDGPTRGRPWASAGVRRELRRLATQAGVRRRFAPHQLRHAHALELAREGVPLNIIQRQLGHTNLGTTSDLPPRHRPRRDHHRRPHPPRPDDVRQRRAATLINRTVKRERPFSRTEAGTCSSTPGATPNRPFRQRGGRPRRRPLAVRSGSH